MVFETREADSLTPSRKLFPSEIRLTLLDTDFLTQSENVEGLSPAFSRKKIYVEESKCTTVKQSKVPAVSPYRVSSYSKMVDLQHLGVGTSGWGRGAKPYFTLEVP